MGIIAFLIIAPVVAAVIHLIVRGETAHAMVSYCASSITAIGACVLAFQYVSAGPIFFNFDSHLISLLFLALDIVLCAVVVRLSVLYKRILPALLAIINLILVLIYELTVEPQLTTVHALYVDELSIIMALIIGVVGGGIGIYSLGYMEDHYRIHSDEPDRRSYFMFLIYSFLSAMFLLVFSNKLSWMFTAWEVTTVASFLLIGFTKSEIAIKNSFTQIILNTLCGISFIAGILIIGSVFHISELSEFLETARQSDVVACLACLPTTLLVLAGLIKAAQAPFQSWLLGAMVAPTPVSALLHSSTMVKAGVFLIIRLSPLLGVTIGSSSTYNPAGILAMLVGGVSFMACSILAVTQSNAKLVLAYSTIANLGLIVACAAVGTSAALWAAIFLLVFHAVSKSLLFICVGSAEHVLGSRDIEHMDGMFTCMPKLARFMIVGICGMFVAPFGMLVSKWAALESFVLSRNIVLIMFLIFGSAATFFFWVKWLAKLSKSVANPRDNKEKGISQSEWFAIWLFGVLTVVLMVLTPLISTRVIVPYLSSVFSDIPHFVLSDPSMLIMIGMLIFLVAFIVIASRCMPETKKSTLYMAGENLGDDRHYLGSMKKSQEVLSRNWYLEEVVNERKVILSTNTFTVILIGIGLIFAATASLSALTFMGGVW